jgi:hypothetical protein
LVELVAEVDRIEAVEREEKKVSRLLVLLAQVLLVVPLV